MLLRGPVLRAVRGIRRPGFSHWLAGLMLAACRLLPTAGRQGRAGTIAWDGDTSTAWATGDNWIGGVAPTDDTTTDLAAFVFGALPAHQPNAGTRSIAGIVIGDGVTAVPGFTIAGTSLSICNSGVSKLAASAAAPIASPTVLATDQVWSNASAISGWRPSRRSARLPVEVARAAPS